MIEQSGVDSSKKELLSKKRSESVKLKERAKNTKKEPMDQHHAFTCSTCSLEQKLTPTNEHLIFRI